MQLSKEAKHNLKKLKETLSGKKKEERQLMVKDLLNDLVREEEVNKRIKENLDKTFDAILSNEEVRRIYEQQSLRGGYYATTAMSFSSIAIGSFLSYPE